MPITGLDWRIVTAAGKVLRTPALPGGGKPNPFCANFTPIAGTAGLVDPDDAQSVGSVVILGQFRALDFGDLWRTKELELMCPTNPIGTIDLYFASSHGAIASGSLPFVHGLQPRVALMQNGTRKGGAPGPMQTMLSSPGFEALWQMHWSYNAMLEQNSPGLYIANIEDMPTIAGVLTAPPRGRGPAAALPPAPAPPAPAAVGTSAIDATSRGWSGARDTAGRRTRHRDGTYAGVHAESRGLPERELYDHEHAQWVQQDLRAALGGSVTSWRGPSSDWTETGQGPHSSIACTCRKRGTTLSKASRLVSLRRRHDLRPVPDD